MKIKVQDQNADVHQNTHKVKAPLKEFSTGTRMGFPS
jgi:hypothetical protein